MRPALLTTGFVLLAITVWLGSASDDLRHSYSFSGQKGDFYSLLAHGLEKGHLYMDKEVDPRVFDKDPKVRFGAERLLDTSIYHGRYYLYFGVVPAALLYLPYHLLTGSDLSQNVPVVLFVALGLLVYWGIFEGARRRYFPGMKSVHHAVSLILLAFGSGTPLLVSISSVYEIPIAAGYLFHALMWLGIFNAWHSNERGARWLGLASLAGGLAVGCRPNYLIALPAVAVAAAVLARGRRSPLGLSAWAVLPAAGVGLLLAAYNFLRFGSPLEFGLHYQLDQMMTPQFSVFSPSFFWSNLNWYFLRPPVFGFYFPYVFPMNASLRPERYYGYESIHGQLAVTILCFLTLAWIWLRWRRVALDPRARDFLVLLAATFAALFLEMGFYGNRAERYIVDFQAPLILLVAIAAGIAAERDAPSRPPQRLKVAFVAISLAASLSNVLASIQLIDRFEQARPATWRLLSYYGNFPAAALESMGLVHFGPIRYRFTLPALIGDVSTAPLVSTGFTNHTDVLYVTQLRGDLAEFTLTHFGTGSVKSGVIPLRVGVPHELEVDFGSFYPPRAHPWFLGKPDDEIEMLKTTLSVAVDGAAVMHQRVRFFDSSPNWLHFGSNPAGIDPPFGGRITNYVRIPARLPGMLLAQSGETGVWRLALTLPFESPGALQPVLGSGTARHGNMLVLRTLENHSVQFGLEQWGAGLTWSQPIPVPSDGLHRVEIFVGSQLAQGKLPAGWRLDPASVRNASSLLRVWLDGAPVWTTRISFNQDSYGWVSIGSNPQGFSSTQAFYFGSIQREPLDDQAGRALVERNITEGAGLSGILRYRIEFPKALPLSGLPLLGAGVTGDGNLVFASPQGPDTYAVGMDDWGYGSQMGVHFNVSPGEHDLEIVVGPTLVKAAHPDSWGNLGSLEPLGDRIVVFIDSKLLGSFRVTHHLDKLGYLSPGANPQGFSTAIEDFGGPLFVAVPMDKSQAMDLVARALSAARQ